MDMTGEQLIPLPKQSVWDGLNDPEILKACIAGCESIERVNENEFKIALTASVGPVKAKFTGKLLLSDVKPIDSYALAFEGSGGAAGFGKGSARVSLSSEGEATRLSYTASASVGGKLAQIGSRLIDGVARKMADDFFTRFNSTLSAPEAQRTGAQAAADAVPMPSPDASAQSSSVRPRSTHALLYGVILALGALCVYLWLSSRSGQAI